MPTNFDWAEYGRQIQQQWETGAITRDEVVQCLTSAIPEHIPAIVKVITGEVRNFVRDAISQAPKTCEEWAAFRTVLKDAPAERVSWEYESACASSQRDYYRVVCAYRMAFED